MNRSSLAALLLLGLLASPAAAEAPQTLLAELRHLRIDGPREWREFPESPQAAALELSFTSEAANDREWTLELRQQDVKQNWSVSLNGTKLNRLVGDENDMVIYLALPVDAVREGDNTLRIEQENRRATDDVRVGEIVLHRQPRADVLGAATVEVQVLDADSQQPLPARLTVVNARGALQTVGAQSNDHLAVRPGVVYTSTGAARFGLPPGKYTLYAGRGFEYSLASIEIELAAGQTLRRTLTVRREVPTEGYVACDTHIHTLSHSGHGDATVQERMITLAAEGIELPVAADHNVVVDHEPFAQEMRVRRYLTPVSGCEVTTRVGHFNVFPIQAGASPPDHTHTEWSALFDSIYNTPGVEMAILNHARDLHSGVRPFGPALFNAAVGENLDGWAMRFNAMEVLNSSATQTDIWRLFHDWMALLNRGRIVTPVGSSDSHDVARHFVGQGRTYIRCDDRDPGNLDVAEAVTNFVQGRVMVSYGLLAELTVEGSPAPGTSTSTRTIYGSGELAPVVGEQVQVTVRVLGPHWVKASQVILFANGQPIREAEISPNATKGLPMGVKWRGQWSIPRPKHDVFLTAIAIGPGIEGLYWKTAKPYQPVTPDWTPHVIGCSGAVWIDVDGDGRRSAAYDYAQRAVAAAQGDFAALLASLADYDQATAAQAAHAWQTAGNSLLSEPVSNALRQAAPAVQAGFQMYLEAWRENQMARAGQ